LALLDDDSIMGGGRAYEGGKERSGECVSQNVYVIRSQDFDRLFFSWLCLACHNVKMS